MPYVDLHSDDDYASIYYLTNTTFGNVGSFDPEKPTVILLHPFFLDSTWLDNQFGDPRLYKNYNMIAFDMRVCGRSSCRHSGRHDSWVEAADLAFCHQILHLPLCHVLAHDNISVNCALRFAFLFPDMCASLTLCNVPAPTELKWVLTAFHELLQSWCFATDLESFEHAGKEGARIIIGPDIDSDLLDEVMAYWQMHLPPNKRVRVLEQANVALNRIPMKPEMLSAITQPVLIIHGDRCDVSPVKYAERLHSELSNSLGGARLYPLKGASGSLCTVPGNASIANQVFAKFMTQQPRLRSDIIPPATSVAERMAMALDKLAEFTNDSSFRARNPTSSLSFSCLTPDVVRSQTESLALYSENLHNAYSPVGPNGRPYRRYSERKEQEHWFSGGKDGNSYAGRQTPNTPGSFMLQKHGKSDSESLLPSSEPTSGDQTQHGRLRRATITPAASVEKHVIKGSMVKVVGTNSTSIGRLLK
ncbi:Alpha/Beta hydrolase protein [Desarmillaria tabescens]|uniref:Alpha/Beta hydrolase protein n=1 Tax=Armillaria tabescens TaxID=1929756 RepID=A0AA39NLQ5_ARMTA|nr:Alpha/Beta hydrolase protein [Desarmillaria tabescens]KAK0467900.1 Alpha/Beta hydrolase protein [Desarmillaria tabescens]